MQAARTASLLCAAASLVTVIGLVLPHPPEIEERGVAAVAMGAAGLALLLRLAAARGSEVILHAAVAGATVLVSFGMLFNGERAGGASGGDEMYYLWVALFAGYHFGRRAAAVHVALIALADAVTLMAIDPGEIGVSRWVTTVGLAAGSAFVVRLLAERIQRLVSELTAAAHTDPLTGLANRRGFELQFERETARAARTGEPFGFLLADVDHFKELNDRRGHAAGDVALVRLARALDDGLRGIDTAARIGGDEFAVLLPGADLAAACATAERIAARVAADAAPLTLTLGSAAYGPGGHTLDELLRAADAELYAAKRRREPRAPAVR
jgi:diguanylate cyclase (GGDEF)-like protein